MKKFTVISLLLVLVAGFAFAGLVPYSNAGYSILSEGTKDDRLQELTFAGNFVAGVVANDLVDINFNIDTTLVDGSALVDGLGTCTFAVEPSLNVAYSGEKLDAGVGFAFPFEYDDGEITELDNLATYLDAFEVTANVSYTNTLKNSENDLTLDGATSFVFDDNLMFGDLDAAATVASDNLTASVGAYIEFASESGVFVKKLAKKANASIAYEYKDVLFSANAVIANYDLLGLDFPICDLLDDKAYQFAFNAGASYAWEKAIGSLALDTYDVLASANVSVNNYLGEKDTDAVASVTVGLPHLVPVELVPNMAFNLPASISAKTSYDVEDKEANFSFGVTVHPIYIEFAKKLSVFDETIDSLDVTFTYANNGLYDVDKTFDNLAHYHSIAASATLNLSKGAVAVTFANNTNPAALTDNVITMSYTKAY